MLTDVALPLAGGGTRITVLTSRLKYDDPAAWLPRTEQVGEVEVIRLWTTRFGRANLVGRAVDYLTFYITAAWALLLRVRRGDVVVVKTDPPMLSVVATPVVKLKGGRTINWLQDLFPEIAEAIGSRQGALSRRAFGFLRWLRNRSLKRADINVVLGTKMEARLLGEHVPASRIRIIPNSADGEALQPIEPSENRLRAEWSLDNAFVVGYSGNLGRAHEYETVLAAIAEIEAHPTPAASGPPPAIKWLFVGGGALYETFKAAVEDEGLTSVIFRPYQLREQLAHSLSAADVHLVSLRPDLEGLIVPSKYYGVAAVGRPAIVIGDEDGEIGQIVTEHKTGLVVPMGDGRALAHAVMALAGDPSRVQAMGTRARLLFETKFDRAIVDRKWRAALTEMRT